MLSTKKKNSSVVGLDIEAGSIAAAEIEVNGTARLGRAGVATLSPGVTQEGEVTDPEALGVALRELFAENKLPRKVRVGVANQRIVVRTLRLPLIEEEKELDTAIRFQAQDQIPMPLDQAVLDWQIAARGVGENNRQMDVVVVAARRDMIRSLLGALNSAGLKPVGIDLAAFGMIRALSHDTPTQVMPDAAGGAYSDGGMGEGQSFVPARLYCNFGDVTNLAVARGTTCLFTRVSPFGVEGIAQRLAERRGLTLEHARQWLAHVGLERPVEDIDGDPATVAATRDTLAEGASKLADELRLSLDFYRAQEGAVSIEEIIACGPGTLIEGLGERLQRDLGFTFRTGRPDALAHLDEATAARLTLSYGLALEE